ncbi:hypothetical protein X975_21854, partial [Stegodyphus mimosarum]
MYCFQFQYFLRVLVALNPSEHLCVAVFIPSKCHCPPPFLSKIFYENKQNLGFCTSLLGKYLARRLPQ